MKWTTWVNLIGDRDPPVCLTCGKHLTGKQIIYCSNQCRQAHDDQRRYWQQALERYWLEQPAA